MRAGLLLLFASAACNTQRVDPPDAAPASVHERLREGDTRLLLSPRESAGTITAQRKIAGGTWEVGLVDLVVDNGELVASADATGAITIERFSVALAPIAIPPAVFGRDASLSNVRAELEAPVVVTTSWIDDDEARATATFDLAFSWALTVEGSTAQLGAPDLPPVTVELGLTGDGTVVHAELRATATGELWSWAGLVKLGDLHLIVGADTP
ncbi:MAG: hypothetical protein H0X17_04145 [Deltaproteobacteria bacterium]|nr:hypothetical protein [Deltaproteobacteria bacterium]